VPTVRTSKKQNGKSNTDSDRYTPTAVQPYSLDSFFSLPLKDSDSSAAAFPSVEALSLSFGREEWMGRLGLKKGVLNCPSFARVAVDLDALSCDINALWCHGVTGALADTLPILPIASLAMLLRAALPPRRASSAPNAVRSMVAKS
jgi:hypothetical protein